ncbi:MAG: hypothetical protein JWR32_4181 [Mycobacterium sp.]|nr:hypothetical protein [Mycobacterium sp.]
MLRAQGLAYVWFAATSELYRIATSVVHAILRIRWSHLGRSGSVGVRSVPDRMSNSFEAQSRVRGTYRCWADCELLSGVRGMVWQSTVCRRKARRVPGLAGGDAAVIGEPVWS